MGTNSHKIYIFSAANQNELNREKEKIFLYNQALVDVIMHQPNKKANFKDQNFGK